MLMSAISAALIGKLDKVGVSKSGQILNASSDVLFRLVHVNA